MQDMSIEISEAISVCGPKGAWCKANQILSKDVLPST